MNTERRIWISIGLSLLALVLAIVGGPDSPVRGALVVLVATIALWVLIVGLRSLIHRR